MLCFWNVIGCQHIVKLKDMFLSGVSIGSTAKPWAYITAATVTITEQCYMLKCAVTVES